MIDCFCLLLDTWIMDAITDLLNTLLKVLRIKNSNLKSVEIDQMLINPLLVSDKGQELGLINSDCELNCKCQKTTTNGQACTDIDWIRQNELYRQWLISNPDAKYSGWTSI